MDIVVLIKFVPDLVEDLEIDAGTGLLDRTFLRLMPSELDDHALEEALLLTERHGGAVTVVTLDTGDVDEAIDYLRFYANEMQRNKGFAHQMRNVYKGEKVRSVLKPYGVWGVVSPFNFPLAIAVGMTAGALVTGNTAVLKPSSDAPRH